MKYWIITDTHFNHLKLSEEWQCRASDWQDKMWASLEAIPEEDTLVHLGDICIGRDAEVHEHIAALPCKKVLVRGNHDHKKVNWYLEHGWDFVTDGIHLDYKGHMLLLTHRPMHPDMWRFTRNLHGHTHGNNHRSEEYHEWYTADYHIDLSPEVIGYAAVLLDDVVENI